MSKNLTKKFTYYYKKKYVYLEKKKVSLHKIWKVIEN